jgi:hypothetical protein
MRPVPSSLPDRHDWLTPSRQPWVQSIDGRVRIDVPLGWKRRRGGEHALLHSVRPVCLAAPRRNGMDEVPI